MKRLSLVLGLSSVLSFALAIACGGEESPPPPAAAPSLAPAAAPAGPAPSGPAPAPEGAERLRYDLAAHLARAELRHGTSPVIDLGTPGGHKYTLGGWRTRVAVESVLEGDASASAITGVTGFVLVPADAPGAQRLTLRARAVADGRLTVYLDGETIGFATLPTDGTYATVSVSVPAERLRVGENTFQFRVPASGAVAGVGSAGLLIDWIRLDPAPAEATEAPPVPPPPAPALLAPREGDEGALAIPDGWSLGYAMELWPGARLRGTARGTGSIEVVAHEDGAAPHALGSVNASDVGAPIDVDLSSLSGHLVRLELVAHGSVRLVSPRIVTLDGAPIAARPTIRNVVVYLTDTLRADKLRPYRAASRVRTPALESWVERAAVALRGHTQENWTKPSVATLLSGLFPWEHHATTEEAVVPGAVDLLSERLGREGFQTGAFIANGFCSDRFGFRQGWGSFRNYIREGLRSQAEFVAHDVLAWLDARDAERPFFLYVHTIDPHVPYLPPSEMLALYDPDPYEGIVDFHRDRELLEGVKSGRIDLNARDRAHLEALYDGEISYHDTHFGAIMEGLERRGLAGETMVVFTADHGEEFWDHGSVGHGHSVFEELVRVPLIVRVPGLTDRPMQLTEALGLVDVAPTIFETLGLPIPEDLSGRSFLDQLRGAVPDAPLASVNGFMDGWRAIELGSLKLIHRTDRVVMLYDLGRDPGETSDVAGSRPIAVRYLRGMLGLTLAGAERGHHTASIEAEALAIDATLRDQLEELGYAGASRAGVDPEADDE